MALIIKFAAYIITSIYCIVLFSSLGVAVELKNKEKQNALIINGITFVIGVIVGILSVV